MAEIIRSTTFFPVNPWVLFRDNDNKNGYYTKGKTYKNERRNSLSNKRTAFHVHILRFGCRFRTSFFSKIDFCHLHPSHSTQSGSISGLKLRIQIKIL